MRIAQIANFVTPTSGGIRTTLTRLRHGYRAAGHDPVLIIPGGADRQERTPEGLVLHIAAPRIPRSGGYRMLVDLRAVRHALEDLRPDRVEVHDRFTLRAVGPWARTRGIPAVAVVHERLDRLAAMHLPWVVRTGPAVRRDNRALAARFETIVSPSHWAAEEFRQAGVPHVRVIRWGVDHDRFRPDRRSPVLRRRLLGRESVLLVLVCRLSPEKQVESAVHALESLRTRGVAARLVVAGTGPVEPRLRRRSAHLPVTFLGHVHSRDHVAELLASADVAICPGPIETFGLAALEALASGTPVVSSRSGAVAELLTMPFGMAAYNHGPGMASAALRLLDEGADARSAARAMAERHPWSQAVGAMLDVHGLAPSERPRTLLRGG